MEPLKYKEDMTWWERFQWKRSKGYWIQAATTNFLHDAWMHVWTDYYSTAANKDRGFILQDTQDALDLLHKLGSESLERQLEL